MRAISTTAILGLALAFTGCGNVTIPPEELGELVTDFNTIPGVDQPYDFKDLPKLPENMPPPID
ncbi:MAG: hypothetical protein AB7O62_03780 [Pirellulales bacterium]